MKIMFALLSAVSLFISSESFAGSRVVSSQPMYLCGGHIELMLADNGDFAVKLENMSLWRCNTLRFTDASSGRILETYTVPTSTSSFTLSREQRDSLSADCRVNVAVWGLLGSESFAIELDSCRGPKTPVTGYSYQWSANHNCKIMKFGVYTNENAPDMYCQGAVTRNDVVTYEFSNKGNCKLMVNSQYTNRNVADYFCTVRH